MRRLTSPLALAIALLALAASAADAQSSDTAYNIAFSDARNKAMKNTAGDVALGESTLNDYRNADELLGEAIRTDEEKRKAKLLEKAMKRAERVTRAAEDWPDGWRLLGQIAFRLEDWDVCRDGFQRAAELYTEDSRVTDAQVNARWCEQKGEQAGAS